MRKGNFWDILAWIILILILLWLVLKVLGIINTPIILEYSPYFGAIYLVGWAMHKLDTAVSEVNEIKRFNRETVKEINDIKMNCLKNHSNKK